MRKEFCRRSWLMGLALGLCGKPLGAIGGEKVPVAYRYGTAVLPGLPECPYPYAVIFANAPWHYVVFTDAPLQLRTTAGYNGYLENSAANWVRYRTSIMMEGYATWELYDKSETAGCSLYAVTLVWANYDLYRTDGTLAIAASDPVPVYE